jgi:hypothetical protein
MGRGLVLSGYPVYPFRAGDVLDFDWKIPGEAVDQMTLALRTYPREPGSASLDVTSLRWIPVWFGRLLPADQALFVLLLGAVGLHSISFLVPVMRPVPASRHGTRRLAAAAWAGVAFWFFGAPIPRYGYFVLFPLLAFHAADLLAALGQKFRRTTQVMLLGSAVCLVLVGACFSIVRSDRRNRLVLPQGYPEVSLVQKSVGGGLVNVPARGEQAWYATLPTTPAPPEGLEWRGRTLSEGFRIARP